MNTQKCIKICGRCQGAKKTIISESGGNTLSELCNGCKGTGLVEVEVVSDKVKESEPAVPGRLSEGLQGVGLLANRLTD